MDFEPKEIIEKLKQYKEQIYRMDTRVKRYLADRKKCPPPGHEDLINEIRRYENQIHGIPGTDVRFWIDNLMNSLFVYEQWWGRAFDEEAAQSSKKKSTGADHISETTPNLLIDEVYAIAQKKWAQFGVTETESKEDLRKKLLPEYDKARKCLKKGEKIAFDYDKKTHEIQVTIKKDDN